MENNNVSYELLAMSNSDSVSDPPKVLNVTRKKKFRRKTHGTRNHSSSSKKVQCTRNRLVPISLLSGVLFCWLFTLTWIAIALHIQTSHLKTTIQGVAAGSQGVPDALQKCHSLSRELQNNQTKLFTQLASLSQRLSNFTAQIGIVQGGLANVEEKLMSSPELVNVPHALQVLSGSVASFGSQIQDLQTTSNQLREAHNDILQTMKTLELNISGINKIVHNFTLVSLNGSESKQKGEICDVEKNLENLVNSLKINVSSINESLSRDLQYVIDDQHKDSKDLEDLKEVSANVSSQLMTVQNEMTVQGNKFKSMEKQFQEVEHFKAHIIEANRQLNDQCKRLETFVNSLGDGTFLKTTVVHEHGDYNLTVGLRTNDTVNINGSDSSHSSFIQGNVTTT